MRSPVIVILFLGIACTSPKEDQLHNQSIEAHNRALEIADKVKSQLKEAEEDVSKCSGTLKPELLDSLSALKEDLTYWESTVTEVPGFEHEHHDGHHHDHHHANELNLTDQMILDIQVDLKVRAEKLLQRSKQLNKKVELCHSE